VAPGAVQPAICETPSTATVNGLAGTCTKTRMGTWMTGSPTASGPRMNRTVTVEPVGWRGEVPTQNDTVLRLTAGLGRSPADGVAVESGGAAADVQPVSAVATATAIAAVLGAVHVIPASRRFALSGPR